MNICVLKAECPNQFKIDKEDLNMVSYQEGYTDAIDECIKVFMNIPRHYYRDAILNELEQLKEKNNDNDRNVTKW